MLDKKKTDGCNILHAQIAGKLRQSDPGISDSVSTPVPAN